METPYIAIQIVNYKTKNFLNPLISSIIKDTADYGQKIEINIIDNDSGDDLRNIAKRWQDQDVHTYKADKNGGFGTGHNVLARKTRARYLLILNPDVLFIENQTVERLMNTLKQYKATVVGPRLLTPKNKARNIPLGNLSPSQLKQQPWDHSLGYVRPYRLHDKLVEAAWVSGAVFLIERESFLESGGFDETFFLYMEEVDLCRQLRKRRQRIIYEPAIRVLHYNHAVAKKNTKQMFNSLPRFFFKMLKG